MEKELLKACRVLVGFSQAELAEKIGVKQPTLCKYENGYLKIAEATKHKVLQALAEKGLNQEEIYMLGQIKSIRG